ncbi:DUF4235 domain-containing protein [Rubripirellula reticaptiva]|uniref:DUF4235 domain-containing protein n=1 Tax=Rubripirellula reticaptiva TaxID=2528013 RepID=A0A5C6EFK2_9BACT|nr:DUF4235 domain-containing protein [Rubripirellula reticaptiva]TWU46817.1 hypothetical protein Poly59_57900 [Rubripirellula reticaptiva]
MCLLYVTSLACDLRLCRDTLRKVLTEGKEMIEELSDRYADIRNGRYDSPLRDEPNGTNDGVAPMENMLAFAVAAGTALVARELLKGGWRAALGSEPPRNPASHEVDWRDAMLWGVMSGAIVGAARIASRRATSSAYNRFRN